MRSIARSIVHSPPRWGAARSFRRSRPAWVNLFIPFAVLIVSVVSLTGLLAFYNGKQAVGELLGRYQQEVVAHIERDLAYRLSIPQRINRNSVAAIELGLLDFDDPDMLERYFWHELKQNVEVNYVYAGSESGGIVGVGRNAEGELRSYRTENFTQGEYSLYRAGEGERPPVRIDREPGYDARTRPWFEPAEESGEERWSEVYRYIGEPLLGVAASKPVLGEGGEFRGVMATDIELSQISAVLRGILRDEGSLLLIMERSGYLVASSSKDDPFMRVAPGELQQRRHARDSDDPLTQVVYQALTSEFESLDEIQQAEDLTLTSGGQRQFVHVRPYQDDGLDWLIAVVMPEQDFMARIHRNTRLTAALCSLGLLTSVVLSMAIARQMGFPLWQLSEASRELARGRFDQQLPVYRTKELNILSRSFNRMVRQLQELFSQLEERNAHLEQRVEERTAHLSQANYQLKLLLRGVSHDLRNPLMGMLMVLNNLREQMAAPQSVAAQGDTMREPSAVYLSPPLLNTLISSGERQLRLVNSLLEDNYIDDAVIKAAAAPPDVSQVETSLLGRHLSLSPCSLQEITQQVEQDVRPLMLRHQATLSTAISHTLPRVLADADQLWRVIENLISNAIAHNTPGIRILITADLVTSTRTGTIVCCKIIDDGVGISQEQQQRLFEPYQQGQKNSPGLGLGLYICRRIVEAHDGTLGVLSQPGAGATFWFTLPIA